MATKQKHEPAFGQKTPEHEEYDDMSLAEWHDGSTRQANVSKHKKSRCTEQEAVKREQEQRQRELNESTECTEADCRTCRVTGRLASGKRCKNPALQAKAAENRRIEYNERKGKMCITSMCSTCSALSHGWCHNPAVRNRARAMQRTRAERGEQYAAQTEKVLRHEWITQKLTEIYETKNAAYGDSFGKSMAEFGITAALVRMEDKWNRIKSLTVGKVENRVLDEAVEDTLIDLANYAIMTLIELEQQKGVKHESN